MDVRHTIELRTKNDKGDDGKMEKVKTNLKAIADAIEQNDEVRTKMFYDLAMEQFDTEEEREAFKQGSLAMFADAGKMRFRRLYRTIRFRRTMKRLS